MPRVFYKYIDAVASPQKCILSFWMFSLFSILRVGHYKEYVHRAGLPAVLHPRSSPRGGSHRFHVPLQKENFHRPSVCPAHAAMLPCRQDAARLMVHPAHTPPRTNLILP